MVIYSILFLLIFFFFSSRRRHTRFDCDLEFRRVLFRSRHVASSRASKLPAETRGAHAPASISRPACSSTRHVVPDSCNKLAAVVTRARVDPLVSVGMSFQLRAASAHHGLDNPPAQSWKLLFGR